MHLTLLMISDVKNNRVNNKRHVTLFCPRENLSANVKLFSDIHYKEPFDTDSAPCRLQDENYVYTLPNMLVLS